MAFRGQLFVDRASLTRALAFVGAVAAVAAWPPAPDAAGQGPMVAPPPPFARTVEVVDPGTPLYVLPREHAARRGRLLQGTRLFFMRRLAAPGCPADRWVQVGPEAYLCEHRVRYSAEGPRGVRVPEVTGGALLPHRYAFVRFDGTRTYRRPSDYLSDSYVEALGEGFALVITGSRWFAGVPFARTRRGVWVDEASLRYARGSDFVGREIRDGEPLRVAWARRPVAVRQHASGGSVLRRLVRRQVVQVVEATERAARLAEGGWVPLSSLSRAVLNSPPEEVGAGERWLDVDIDNQVLVAYQGAVPRYATLVSTGRARPGSATPLGTFRIWVKLAFSDMSNLRDQGVSRHYAMEQVPWVQYFEGSHGLHAAFWHDDFGTRRSHGCVNLAPRDARWLFEFTGPQLPKGWDAIFPTGQHQGSIVHVH